MVVNLKMFEDTLYFFVFLINNVLPVLHVYTVLLETSEGGPAFLKGRKMESLQLCLLILI